MSNPTGQLPSVCVITATTGHPNLSKCIDSVRNQIYRGPLEHLVVVDGPEWDARADQTFKQMTHWKNLQIIRLPHATGKDGWCGHRIYAAIPFILPSADFISFLDEDNWFEPDHIEALVAAVERAGASWGFSLRKVVDPVGNFIVLDQCESLGSLHHVFSNRQHRLIDTSCYLLKRELANQLATFWNRPTESTPAPDRLVCQVLMKHFPDGACSMRHSLNYTVGNNPRSVGADFFIQGNQAMRQMYPNGLPWEKHLT